MIHQNPELNAAEAVSDWRDDIAIGDIIRWPLAANSDDSDGLALVIDIETIGNWQVLTVAPGIDDVAQPVRPGTLRLTRLDEVRDAGLMKPVRFELARRISIAPQHPGLANGSASPVVGHLCENALDRLYAERARIHALRDIAAARRSERRANRSHDSRTVWRPSPARPAPALTINKPTEDRA